MKPKVKIKKGYGLFIVPDTIENLCQNCFFHNPHTGYVQEKYILIAYPGCLKSNFMECPSKAHKTGKNMIYKLINIKEAQNA